MKYICHVCGGDDSKGGCVSGCTGLFTCKECFVKKGVKTMKVRY